MRKNQTIECSFVNLVQVQILGHYKAEYAAREDDGLVRRFLEWQAENKVFPVLRSGGYSGAGSYMGYFTPEDAEQVKIWLRSQVEETS